MPLGGINSFAFSGYLTGNTFSNAAGSGNGAPVTVACTFTNQFGNGLLPSTYVVSVAPSQACFASVSAKSATGFTVTLTPTTSGVTLATGTVDVIVTG